MRVSIGKFEPKTLKLLPKATVLNVCSSDLVADTILKGRMANYETRPGQYSWRRNDSEMTATEANLSEANLDTKETQSPLPNCVSRTHTGVQSRAWAPLPASASVRKAAVRTPVEE